MVKKLIMVVTYCEKFLSINLHDPSNEVVKWVHLTKLNKLYLHFKKVHGHQTEHDTYLPWETPTLQTMIMWPT